MDGFIHKVGTRVLVTLKPGRLRWPETADPLSGRDSPAPALLLRSKPRPLPRASLSSGAFLLVVERQGEGETEESSTR